MKSFRSSIVIGVVAALAATSLAGCGRTVVIVPRPARGYTAMDTLDGLSKGKNVRVTFHFDTLWRTNTVTRVDTLWRAGTRTDTLVRVDTVTRVTTRVRVDTVGFERAIPYATPAPLPVPVPVTRVDTIRVTVRDTLFRVDTVRVAGRRVLFVPPGQYPPEGQCRIWIHDVPPGRQADAAPCNALGAVPPGAFILFRGDAWDFDYDWLWESRRSNVPPEIMALQRRGRP